jgi:uncharacterized protein (TIGR00251 family)
MNRPPVQPRISVKPGMSCLQVRVQTRSSRNEIAGLHGEGIRVRLTAPPLQDRANRQLQKLLAQILGLSKDRVLILSGHHSRTKMVGIRGLNDSELLERITPYLV